MSIKIGNLLPGQEIKVSAQLLQPTTVRFSSYSFVLPYAFYPNYEKLGSSEPFPYKFSYSVILKSSEKISQICKPEGSICE